MKSLTGNDNIQELTELITFFQSEGKDSVLDAYIIAMFLAKFDTKGFEDLGFSSWKQTFDHISNILDRPPNTIKQYRDIFDSKYSYRIGHKKDLTKPQLKIYQCFYKELWTIEKMSNLVRSILDNGKLWAEKYLAEYDDQQNHKTDLTDNRYETKTISFMEGKEFLKTHFVRERDSRVSKLAKETRFKDDKFLRCDVCGFSFVEVYGELGKGFIEAHHAIPISSMNGEQETNIQDIALVCSNCHKMIHRYRPWLKIDELKKILQK